MKNRLCFNFEHDSKSPKLHLNAVSINYNAHSHKSEYLCPRWTLCDTTFDLKLVSPLTRIIHDSPLFLCVRQTSHLNFRFNASILCLVAWKTLYGWWLPVLGDVYTKHSRSQVGSLSVLLQLGRWARLRRVVYRVWKMVPWKIIVSVERVALVFRVCWAFISAGEKHPCYPVLECGYPWCFILH